MSYHARTFDHLKRLRGFSDRLMKSHLGLYQGYVKNTNHLAAVLLNKVKLGKANTIEYAEMKRRFGWEFNGMRLHELYFENLSPRPVPLRKASPLYEKIRQDFGQFGTWERGFMGVGGMRGIGWAVLTCDPVSGRHVRIEHGAEIDECVILDGVRIGSKARLRRVIVDRYNVIPDSTEMGSLSEADRKGYQTTDSGLVVLPRGLSGGKHGFNTTVCS